MAHSYHRRNRRNGTKPSADTTFREPEITRYSHPIHTALPCAEDLAWMRGTLACHSRMLSEILERLPASTDTAK